MMLRFLLRAFNETKYRVNFKADVNTNLMNRYPCFWVYEVSF